MDNPWFDTEGLARWLSLKLGAGYPAEVLDVRRLPGGLSAETYHLKVGWERTPGPTATELVLRRDPVGGLVERDIEREYRVMLALRDSPVPLPRVYALELDPAWLERPFFVDDFCPGTTDRNLFNSAAYTSLRPRLGEQFIEILARLHTFDLREWGLDFLANPGPGTCPAAREVESWEDLVSRKKQEPSPLLVEAFLWMKANLPTAPRISLVHGEYRPGNFLYEGDRITAVVDWEYAHLGDPVEDIGWAFMKQFRVGAAESGFFPREEFLERYEERSGYAVDRKAVRFWEVFSNMKVMAIMTTGQDAFRHKKMDTAIINAGPGSNVQAEIARLIDL